MKETANVNVVLVAVVPAALAVFVIFVLVMPQVRENRVEHEQTQVTTFAECVAAGNPVMESYPRQCRNGEQLFVEEIEATLPDGYTLDTYTVAEVTDVSCGIDDECETPSQYLIQSNCPYTSRCIEQRCTVVCPGVD
jgi:hypothetical protein